MPRFFSGRPLPAYFQMASWAGEGTPASGILFHFDEHSSGVDFDALFGCVDHRGRARHTSVALPC
jgi:hypothetical protein